jgi:hypothetical protein
MDGCAAFLDRKMLEGGRGRMNHQDILRIACALTNRTVTYFLEPVLQPVL